METLLSHGSEANFTYHGTRTLLHTAIRDNAPLETIRVLLRHGASVTAPDENGKTALDYALHGGYRSLIPLLKAAARAEQRRAAIVRAQHH